MTSPDIIAKIVNMLWWYTAYGQRLGVLFVAFNRLSVIIFKEVSDFLIFGPFLIVWNVFIVGLVDSLVNPGTCIALDVASDSYYSSNDAQF